MVKMGVVVDNDLLKFATLGPHVSKWFAKDSSWFEKKNIKKGGLWKTILRKLGVGGSEVITIRKYSEFFFKNCLLLFCSYCRTNNKGDMSCQII